MPSNLQKRAQPPMPPPKATESFTGLNPIGADVIPPMKSHDARKLQLEKETEEHKKLSIERAHERQQERQARWIQQQATIRERQKVRAQNAREKRRHEKECKKAITLPEGQHSLDNYMVSKPENISVPIPVGKGSDLRRVIGAKVSQECRKLLGFLCTGANDVVSTKQCKTDFPAEFQ